MNVLLGFGTLQDVRDGVKCLVVLSAVPAVFCVARERPNARRSNAPPNAAVQPRAFNVKDERPPDCASAAIACWAAATTTTSQDALPFLHSQAACKTDAPH